jgi:hypothetical protein
MGHQFTFVGNQFKLQVDDKEYFIDLLLYHRELRCLVAIELKIGEFQPEYKGKFEDNNINNIECKQGDVGNIPFGNETFDTPPVSSDRMSFIFFLFKAGSNTPPFRTKLDPSKEIVPRTTRKKG